MAHDFVPKSSMLHLDRGVTFPDAKSPMPSTLAVRAWDFLLFRPSGVNSNQSWHPVAVSFVEYCFTNSLRMDVPSFSIYRTRTYLLILVHFLVVFLVVAAGDVLHPLLVVEVPVDGQDDALLEGSLGIPAKVVLDLGGVDAIAAVMAQTVSDVLDEVFADAIVLQAVVQLLDDGLDDEDVGALVVAADIVDLAHLAAVADHINGLAVVLNVQPVADLHTVAVDGQLLVVLDVVDHQRG